jgi:Na+-driven multidrug efflux pump
MFMFGMGLSNAVCTTVGHQIGRGDHAKAKKYYQVSRHIALTLIVVVVTIQRTQKTNIIGLFTNIDSVKDKCFEVILYQAIGTFPDLWQAYL